VNYLTYQHQLPQTVGVGLRSCHYAVIESENPDIPWFEILTDNYLCDGGPNLYHLEKICTRYPVTLHGIGMSLGSTDPLDKIYLQRLKKLMAFTNPLLVSDHLCWTSYGNQHFHELLPLPYTEEAVMHVANRIQQVQDFLGQQIMIENVSTYLQFSHSTLKEWEFLNAVANEADCLILLDINNIYVSAYNNHFDPLQYINTVTKKRVAQFHLAGYNDQGPFLLDTHSAPIHLPVWKLFIATIKRFGQMPTIIEWDNDIPEFSQLIREAQRASMLMNNYAYTT
jgi:uncharacterized protein (UPF0276 family)